MARLIEIAEALSLIRQHVWQPCESERVPLLELRGRILAEDVASDVDSPPHDKSLVDGFAVCSQDFVDQSAVTLEIIEDVHAGQIPVRAVQSGATIRIMTGAPLPVGADAVVMVEQTKLSDDGRFVTVHAVPQPNQNIMRRRTVMQANEIVLRQGSRLNAAAIGLLAEVGRSHVTVFRRPRVAVLPTGDELVPCHQAPGAGMIRNSNGPMLQSMLAAAGAVAVDLGIGKDTIDDLRSKIAAGLQSDVLILSGGVSAGVKDLVPQVLAELDVQPVFHKVNIKPGKPLWFGFQERKDQGGTETSNRHRTFVLGLPGNPVSSLVCFMVFVKPLLSLLQGVVESVDMRLEVGHLVADHSHEDDRPTFKPAVVDWNSTERTVEVLQWHGSSDLKTIAHANALAFFRSAKHYVANSLVDLLRL